MEDYLAMKMNKLQLYTNLNLTKCWVKATKHKIYTIWPHVYKIEKKAKLKNRGLYKEKQKMIPIKVKTIVTFMWLGRGKESFYNAGKMLVFDLDDGYTSVCFIS